MASRSDFCLKEGKKHLRGLHQWLVQPFLGPGLVSNPWRFCATGHSLPLDGNSSPAKLAEADSCGRRMESPISSPVPRCLPNPGPGSSFCSGSWELASPEPCPALCRGPSPAPSTPHYSPLQNTGDGQQPLTSPQNRKKERKRESEKERK